MRPDAGRGPMIDGADFQVVFGYPEGLLHLPQATVLAQDGRIVRIRQVGDDAVQAIPALCLFDLVPVNTQFGLALDLEVLLVAVVVQ